MLRKILCVYLVLWGAIALSHASGAEKFNPSNLAYFVLQYVVQGDGMPLTVRLKKKEEDMLYQTAKAQGQTRSSVVREAIVQYCSQKLSSSNISVYEAMKDAIGCFSSGRTDLSVRAHELFKEAMIAKYGGKNRARSR